MMATTRIDVNIKAGFFKDPSGTSSLSVLPKSKLEVSINVDEEQIEDAPEKEAGAHKILYVHLLE